MERTFTLEHGLACGAGLATIGLALVIRQSVEGWGPVAAGGLAASTTILGLLATVLGAKLWFDAFFLTMCHLKRPALMVAVPSTEFSAQSLEDSASIEVPSEVAN